MSSELTEPDGVIVKAKNKAKIKVIICKNSVIFLW